MSKLVATVSTPGVRYWLKDVAALGSIGAFVWVAGTWLHIARALLQS